MSNLCPFHPLAAEVEVRQMGRGFGPVRVSSLAFFFDIS